MSGGPLRHVLLVLALSACMSNLAAAGEAAAQALPSFEQVRAAHRPSDQTLLDRHGVQLQTLRTDSTVRRLDWLALADVSPALLHAVVLSEDQRFYEHSGVDWSAVANSAWANLWNQRTRGASTLTMQLAGLLDDSLVRPAAGRTLEQKVGQVITARELERHWSKAQILEAYLNSVPFRGEIVGLGALSFALFGKHASGLDTHEAAIATALLRAPNANAQAVAARACGVLQSQQLDCFGIEALAQRVFAPRRVLPAVGEQLAPHVARQLLSRGGASRQPSTLDAGTQRFAIAALNGQLAELAGRQVEDGAVLVLDNATGAVRAWVGGSGPARSAAPEVDHVLARRQPGSTLKPFVYQLAFEQRLITPASLLDDSPAQIATTSGLYLPQNYDRTFAGWISARTALGASLNVPAVRVGTLLGADALATRLNAFGFALPQPGGFYGSSLALGSADVSLLALTNAYRALANGGVVSPVVFKAVAGDHPSLAARLSPVAATQRVSDAVATHLVVDILADNNARMRTFGLDSQLATYGFAAVKTGTSKDMRDNWCIGFTDRFTVGVWVGNTSGAAMHEVSGVSGAAPVWRALVGYLHAGQPSQAPSPPPGVVALTVAFEGASEPPRRELFVAGTERASQQAGVPASTAGAAVADRRFGISSPRDGSIFALDPDIPPSAQRIAFEGESGQWMLDGAPIGDPDAKQLQWAPWPGRHRLALHRRDGSMAQTIEFEVRGAVLRRQIGGNNGARAASTR
ncbi:MAG: penicillin-binding protein 1C [Burkholderiales bacterium]